MEELTSKWLCEIAAHLQEGGGGGQDGGLRLPLVLLLQVTVHVHLARTLLALQRRLRPNHVGRRRARKPWNLELNFTILVIHNYKAWPFFELQMNYPIWQNGLALRSRCKKFDKNMLPGPALSSGPGAGSSWSSEGKFRPGRAVNVCPVFSDQWKEKGMC